MKRRHVGIIIFMLGILQSLCVSGQSVTRSTVKFDFDWKFYQGDPEGASDPRYDDKSWRLLDLPHDWSVEGTVAENEPAGGSGGYFPTGLGWYRRHFSVKRNDLKMNNYIVFDGVYMNSDVWLNGKHLGNYPFGYNSFYYDLDPYLKEGDNVIAVRVDNSKQPNSRWYSGSGIYRHVWLVRTAPLHIEQWGVYVTTPAITKSQATVSVSTRFENSSPAAGKAMLTTLVTDKNGSVVGQLDTPFQVDAGRNTVLAQQIIVPSPDLWSVDSPSMYSLVSKIFVNGKMTDEVITPFGIRSVLYDTDKGFLLNGESIKMNGVCLHHDAGCLGAAVPIKSMGTPTADSERYGLQCHPDVHIILLLLNFLIYATGWGSLLWMKYLMNGR